MNVANTIVHRGDPVRSFDRFDDAAEIPRFAEAASRFCAGEIGGVRLVAEDGAAIRPIVLAIREATDSLVRSAVPTGHLSTTRIASLLKACGRALGGSDLTLGPAGLEASDARQGVPFEAALAVSALSLLAPKMVERARICPNCAWLFLDRSRNGSRRWCDMAVCGNRSKARRHYRRLTVDQRS